MQCVLTGLTKFIVLDGYTRVYFSLQFFSDIDGSNFDYIASNVCSKLSDEQVGGGGGGRWMEKIVMPYFKVLRRQWPVQCAGNHRKLSVQLMVQRESEAGPFLNVAQGLYCQRLLLPQTAYSGVPILYSLTFWRRNYFFYFSTPCI